MTAPFSSPLVFLVAASCGFSLSSAMLLGGAVSVRINTRQPTDRSRRWGWILGAINLVQGGVGLWLVVQMATKPMEDPPELDVYLLIGGGTLAALVIGALGIFAATRARSIDADHQGGNTPA